MTNCLYSCLLCVGADAVTSNRNDTNSSSGSSSSSSSSTQTKYRQKCVLYAAHALRSPGTNLTAYYSEDTSRYSTSTVTTDECGTPAATASASATATAADTVIEPVLRTLLQSLSTVYSESSRYYRQKTPELESSEALVAITAASLHFLLLIANAHGHIHDTRQQTAVVSESAIPPVFDSVTAVLYEHAETLLQLISVTGHSISFQPVRSDTAGASVCVLTCAAAYEVIASDWTCTDAAAMLEEQAHTGTLTKRKVQMCHCCSVTEITSWHTIPALATVLSLCIHAS